MVSTVSALTPAGGLGLESVGLPALNGSALSDGKSRKGELSYVVKRICPHHHVSSYIPRFLLFTGAIVADTKKYADR